MNNLRAANLALKCALEVVALAAFAYGHLHHCGHARGAAAVTPRSAAVQQDAE